MTEPNDILPPENTSPEAQTPTETSVEPSLSAPAGTPLKSPPAITVRAPSAETIWAEIVVAVNFLTRIDLRLREEPKPRIIRRSMSWFPIVGAAIGLAGASVDWIMTQIGLPGLMTAAFAVISMLWLTRAMHEEEFASMANLYSKGMDQGKQKGWLKEERSVQYGTLAVILVMIMKIGAIASLNSSEFVFQSLIASSCWSRTLMVVTTGWLRPIQGDPVADYFQQPSALRVLLALVIGGFITFLALDTYAPIALTLGAGAGLIVALVGANHLRGYNGPLLGTLQNIVELTILGTALAIQ